MFSYDHRAFVIRAFCERWCSTTNTLHTSIREVSISLWDLYRIVGLPIIESFYYEMVPSIEELSNNTMKSLVPPSYRNLFLTYYHICSETKGKFSVKTASWVSFWYKGPIKYVKTLKKSSRNKMQRPKETYNHSNDIVESRTQLEIEVFDNLSIAKEDARETYLDCMMVMQVHFS